MSPNSSRLGRCHSSEREREVPVHVQIKASSQLNCLLALCNGISTFTSLEDWQLRRMRTRRAVPEPFAGEAFAPG